MTGKAITSLFLLLIGMALWFFVVIVFAPALMTFVAYGLLGFPLVYIDFVFHIMRIPFFCFLIIQLKRDVLTPLWKEIEPDMEEIKEHYREVRRLKKMYNKNS